MKFVVTGGAGFIGSNIVKLLVSKGHSVDVIDNLHTGKKENLDTVFDDINFHQIDIRNKEELHRIMKDCDGIFHQAALTVVPESFEIPQEYFQVNVEGTKNIFEIAKNEKLRVVYASSSSIYGNVNKTPITESFEKNPINPYGKTKLECEFLAQKFASKGSKIIGLRYFNVFGIGQTGTYAGVITKFMDSLSKEESPTIYGDGSQLRSVLYVKDAIDALILASCSEFTGAVWFAANENSISVNELASSIVAACGSGEIVNVKWPDDRKRIDVGDIVIDCSKISGDLDWNPKVSLEDGLRNTVKYWESVTQ